MRRTLQVSKASFPKVRHWAQAAIVPMGTKCQILTTSMKFSSSGERARLFRRGEQPCESLPALDKTKHTRRETTPPIPDGVYRFSLGDAVRQGNDHLVDWLRVQDRASRRERMRRPPTAAVSGLTLDPANAGKPHLGSAA